MFLPLALVEATFVTPSTKASLVWKTWLMVTHNPLLWPVEACCSLREQSRSGPVFQVPHQGDCWQQLQLPTGFHEGWDWARRPD